MGRSACLNFHRDTTKILARAAVLRSVAFFSQNHVGLLVLLADTELEYMYTARMVLTQYQVAQVDHIGVKLTNSRTGS